MTATAPTRLVTINAEQKLYVVPCGNEGHTCWGFQNAWDETLQLAEALKVKAPADDLFGTLALYELHRHLVAEVRRTGVKLGTWFKRSTPIPVRTALERARHSRNRVRLWKGDTTTGQAWLSEFETLGTIGRSMGPLMVPLLIEKGARGGGAILDDCILRIHDLDLAEDLYKHRKFHVPDLVIQATTDPNEANRKSHPFAVALASNNEEQARFKTYAKAAAWIAFMHGEIMENPNPLQLVEDDED